MKTEQEIKEMLNNMVMAPGMYANNLSTYIEKLSILLYILYDVSYISAHDTILNIISDKLKIIQHHSNIIDYNFVDFFEEFNITYDEFVEIIDTYVRRLENSIFE